MLRAARRGNRGFTLVETLAAILVLAIVTLGLVPLLAASLRGSNLGRSSNIAKNLAVKAMERARGLPFFVDYDTQPNVSGGGKLDVDVLDFYNPGPSNPANASGVVTTVCNADGTVTPNTVSDRACPEGIPEDYTVTFEARFVKTDGATTEPTPGAYDTNTSGADEPPSSLMDFAVEVDWDAVLGRDREYRVTTLLGDRAFGRLMRGVADVKYGVQVTTSFDADPDTVLPQITALTAEAGASRSEIEQRSTSIASQDVTAATISLFDEDDPARPIIEELDDAGALAKDAPPDGTAADDVGTAETIVTPVELLEVAGIDATVAGQPATRGDVTVSVADEAPAAQGGFSFDEGASALDFWVDNPQADRTTGRAARLQLIPDTKLFSVVEDDNADAGDTLETIEGWTDIETEDKLFGGVETEATFDFEELRLFPAAFVTDPNYGGALVVIEEFQALVTCDAYSRPSVGLGAAEATWSATLKYWRETNANDGTTAGGYVDVPLSGALGTDPLAALSDAIGDTNPVVYEAPDPGGDPLNDLKLFDDGVNLGYLQSWTSDADMANNEVDTDPTQTAATLDGAIRIDTVEIPAAATSREFPMSIVVGSLECEAVDFR
jgi:prepilin-type N-terminal cleavage/methylation domain-containing protein